MQVRIRADASTQTGAGHIMRCLRLAHALAAKGDQVAFLCRPQVGDLCATILEEGFELIPISARTEQEDLAVCQRVLVHGVDILILDHYELGPLWERGVRPFARRMLMIEDLPDREHLCDVLLDQNVLDDHDTLYAGRVPQGCRLLLGPRYALLDDSFREIPAEVSDRTALRRVLLFFGGGDAGNYTGCVLEEIGDLGLDMDVVIGSSNRNGALLAELCETFGARLHVQTQEMARLMAAADLMLGAGGSTHWERCRMGLPGLIMAVARNQEFVSCKLAERGACWYLGASTNVVPGTWRRHLQALRSDPRPLLAMQAAARRIVPDADGCQRVIAVLREGME